MRFAVVDSWGIGTSWPARLKAEGSDVLVYVANKDPIRHVGDGLYEKEFSYDRFVAWAKEAPGETVVLFMQKGSGDQADELRRAGLRVVGAGAFADKLEQDRLFGQSVAESIGIEIPKFRAYSRITDAIDDWRRAHDEGGVFKADRDIEADSTQLCCDPEQMVRYLSFIRERHGDRMKFMIQQLIDADGSVDFDVNRWWNGQEFVGPWGFTMEKKRFLNDDLGPSTGASITAFWWQEEHDFPDELNFEALADLFRSYEAPPCVYAINCRVDGNDGKPKFLEFTSRLGFDSEMTSALLIENLSEFLWFVAGGEGSTTISNDLAYTVRMTVPPYPNEHVERYPEGQKSAEGIFVPYSGNVYSPPFVGYELRTNEDGGYDVASVEGYVGLAAAVGTNLTEMGEEVLEFAHDLHKSVSKLQLRTDGVKVIQDDARKLEALGYEVHPAILEGAEQERGVA